MWWERSGVNGGALAPRGCGDVVGLVELSM